MKYLVFVDFDGVLTNKRIQYTVPSGSYEWWAQFDPVVIQFFNKIHHTFRDVSFVWSTSWRYGVDCDSIQMQQIVYSMWYNAGFQGKFAKPWKVNPDDENTPELNHDDRAGEIKHYLETYASSTEDFLIFDDERYPFDQRLGRKRHIRTDENEGMLTRHYKRAWELLGQWDKK